VVDGGGGTTGRYRWETADTGRRHEGGHEASSHISWSRKGYEKKGEYARAARRAARVCV
jgi:hypothetical protein